MLRGFIAILPLAISAAAYGLAFGVVSADAGFSVLEISVMSLVVFAGTSQIAAVEAFSGGQAMLGAILAAAVLNLRYIGILATMPSILGGAKWPLKIASIHLTADENWANSLSVQRAGKPVDAWFHFGSGLGLIFWWWASTSVGNLLGSTLPEWTSVAVGFAFTAAFIGMLVGMMNLRFAEPGLAWLRSVLPVVVTFGSMLVLLQVPGMTDYAFLGAIALGLIVALAWRGDRTEGDAT